MNMPTGNFLIIVNRVITKFYGIRIMLNLRWTYLFKMFLGNENHSATEYQFVFIMNQNYLFPLVKVNFIYFSY